MARMAFKVLDRLFIVVYGQHDPTPDEWTEYLLRVEQQGVDRTMQLIFTEGGGPNQQQRVHLGWLLAGRSVPVAVVTSLVAVRMTVTVMSFLNPKLRVFQDSELTKALAHLEIPSSRLAVIEREVEKLYGSLRSTAGKIVSP